MEKITLSYGELPKFTAFCYRYLEVCTEKDYEYSLVGSDKGVAKDANIPVSGSFKAVELYTIIERLIAAFEGGNQAAGDLASSFMSTLNYEWI